MFFNSTPSVSVTEAAELITKPNTAFIDVRTRGEYVGGHARGAQNIPLDSFSDADMAKLQNFNDVYVICQSGGRSSVATKALTKRGVRATNVAGGTMAWRAHGLPMA